MLRALRNAMEGLQRWVKDLADGRVSVARYDLAGVGEDGDAQAHHQPQGKAGKAGR